jgi:hypothetical protein
MVYYNNISGGTVCMPNDQTFYCRLSRFSSEVSMIFGLLFLIVLVYTFISGKNLFDIFKKK